MIAKNVGHSTSLQHSSVFILNIKKIISFANFIVVVINIIYYFYYYDYYYCKLFLLLLLISPLSLSHIKVQELISVFHTKGKKGKKIVRNELTSVKRIGGSAMLIKIILQWTSSHTGEWFNLSFEHFDVISIVDKSTDEGKLLSIW